MMFYFRYVSYLTICSKDFRNQHHLEWVRLNSASMFVFAPDAQALTAHLRFEGWPLVRSFFALCMQQYVLSVNRRSQPSSAIDGAAWL